MKKLIKIFISLCILIVFISAFESHEIDAATKKITSVSKVGKIKNTKIKIYKNINNLKKSSSAGSKNTNKTFYIKKQAKINKTVYYLLSTDSEGKKTIGWVKSSGLNTYNYKVIDKKKKTFYINGTGVAYSQPWGGSKEIVYKNLSSYKFAAFKVDLTASVGASNNYWYRGKLGRKTVWIHKNNVTSTFTKSDVSRLGQIKANGKIYNKLSQGAKTISNKNYLNTTLYIKQQAKFGNEVYYLLSTKPSKTQGLIGWIKSTDVLSYAHYSIDKNKKLFYIKGTGYAYSKPWGGTKDQVYKLSNYSGQDFNVNLTEAVNGKTNYWYQGTLNGKTIWIHQSHVTLSYEKQTKYDITLAKALEYQMKNSTKPQTDLYRNDPAYIERQKVSNLEVEIIGTKVNLRTSPELKGDSKGAPGSNVEKTIEKLGTKFPLIDPNIKGNSVGGSTKWYKIQDGDQELYVHSSLSRILGTTTENVKVYENKSSNSFVYGTINKGTSVIITNVEDVNWVKISYAWRNAKESDVKYYLNPENFKKDKIQKFQFLDLRRTTGVTVAQLNNYLKGKGILENQGQAFIDAGKKYGVNELYLVAHAMLETGNGTSALAKGIKYKDIIVYNMFGIGAYDNCPNDCGAKYAYEKGWTTPAKAIEGGAQFISQNYIYGKYNQTTVYKMRWNPEGIVKEKSVVHQYATDIGWGYKQVNNLYNLYNNLKIKNVYLDIPLYK